MSEQEQEKEKDDELDFPNDYLPDCGETEEEEGKCEEHFSDPDCQEEEKSTTKTTTGQQQPPQDDEEYQDDDEEQVSVIGDEEELFQGVTDVSEVTKGDEEFEFPNNVQQEEPIRKVVELVGDEESLFETSEEPQPLQSKVHHIPPPTPPPSIPSPTINLSSNVERHQSQRRENVPFVIINMKKSHGPFQDIDYWRNELEKVGLKAQELRKIAENIRNEMDDANEAVNVSNVAVESCKLELGNRKLSQRTVEQRQSLSKLEHEKTKAIQNRDIILRKLKKAIQNAEKAEEEERALKLEFGNLEQRANDFEQSLNRCNITLLNNHEVCDILLELGLGKFVRTFEMNGIDGEVLSELGDERLKKLGITLVSYRQKLRYAIQMVNSCGKLHLDQSILEEIAQIAATQEERDSVLIVTWNTQNVIKWLESIQISSNIRDKILKSNITGEQLLQITDDDLERIGVSLMGDRVKLLKRIEFVQQCHFSALNSFFISKHSSSLPPSTTGAAPSPSAPPITESISCKNGSDFRSNVSYDEIFPSEFVCPISQDLMTNPVVAPDGFVYEESEIKKWLKTHNTSPMTGIQMEKQPLTLCKPLRSAIIAWKEKHQKK